jgi:hypothetical protein
MAFNEITLPRWQQLVRRRFGLVGPGGNVPVLAAEIQPTVEVEPAAFEHEALRGIFHYSLFDNVGAAGNSVLWIELKNQSDSNKLIVVKGVRVLYSNSGTSHAGVSQTVACGIRQATANLSAGPARTGSRDFRRSINQSSGGLWHQAAAPGTFAFTTNMGLILPEAFDGLNGFVAGALSLDLWYGSWREPVLLIPDSSFAINVPSPGVNASAFMLSTWDWYEQDLEIAEARGVI